MKIGIEAQRIFRNNKHGIEFVALELIGQIQHLDSQNEFFVLAKDGPDNNVLKNSDRLHTVIVKGFSYPDWEQIALPAAIRKQNIQLLHCTANTAPIRPGVPLILTLHDVIFLENIDFKGSSYQNFGNLYRRAVVPRAIKNAEQIITVSNAEKTIILETCKLPSEKVEVIYNGVNERFRKIEDQNLIEQFRRKFQLPKEFLLFHGNTAPKKNTRILIEAFVQYTQANSNSIPLVITDLSKEQVHQQLKAGGNEGLLSKMIFTGYLPSGEMPLLYNCATAFLYPSLRESFGLPILEAMACGVPVITADRSATKEVSGHAALLVDPERVEEIAAAMTTVVDSDATRHDLIQKGYQQAARFSWKDSAIKLLEVYNRFA